MPHYNLRLDRGPCVRRYQDVEVATPQLQFAGKVRIELIHAASGIIKQVVETPNMVLNTLLNRYGSEVTTLFGVGAASSCMMFYMQMGTGNTPPVVTDTGLASAVAPRTNTGADVNPMTYSYVTGPPDYAKVVRGWQFSESQANGNLSEFGIWDALSGGNLLVRALIKDSSGVPIVITKTDTDILRVYYEFRSYLDPADIVGSITLDGTTSDWTFRVARAAASQIETLNTTRWPTTQTRTAETNVLVPYTATPVTVGTQIVSSLVWATYVADTYRRDATIICDPGNSNYATGLGSFLINHLQNGTNQVTQLAFNPKITKTATKRLTLNVRFSWNRYVIP